MSEKDTKFKKGNEIGIETRFKPGNTLSKKYKSEYADSLLLYFLTCEKLPTIEEWAVKNQLAIRTVYDWTTDEKKYPRFAATYAQAKAIQKTKLVQNGLKEVYNATLVKFLLINNHGMSDKTLNDTTVTFNVDYGSDDIDEESN